MRSSGCFAGDFYLAQPTNDLVPTQNALGRQDANTFNHPRDLAHFAASPEKSIN